MASVIDTSKMNEGQRAALETAEAARTEAGEMATFASSLFLGCPDFSNVFPFPLQSDEDKAEGNSFLAKLDEFLKSQVDADAIDRDGEIPDEVLAGLAELKAFAIKIPKEYGGLGLSQTNYARAATLLGSHCANLTALLSAHQSIGVPQPLLTFGTDEQKQKYLPRFAKGEISAFALTENDVGSDPARMKTTAVREGDEFVINGEKLWCTNGTKAGVIVVMAKTSAPDGDASARQPITAFIVEMDAPGVEVVTRCHFMGLRALYNGVIRFTNVRVHKDAILCKEGKGLKVALTTLNTGRLTLPAGCLGLAKNSLAILRRWAAEREQWGAPIGKHAAIADKIARIAAQTFAMEAMTEFVCALVDRDKNADIRIEAAMAKMWGTERGWEIADETMQVRGGRGYETADSLKARGEDPIAVERNLRDARINTIFEGSSEIMRLFIAREALDPHLKIGGPVLDSRAATGDRVRAGFKAGLHYAWWYPTRWLPLPARGTGGIDSLPRCVVRFVNCRSRKLSRALFHGMARYGPKLDRQQLFLGRIVEIGTELFALSCAASKVQALLDGGASKQEREDLLMMLKFLCEDTRKKIDANFQSLHAKGDTTGYRLAARLLDDQEALPWLEL